MSCNKLSCVKVKRIDSQARFGNCEREKFYVRNSCLKIGVYLHDTLSCIVDDVRPLQFCHAIHY